jgi:hypothetical protein
MPRNFMKVQAGNGPNRPLLIAMQRQRSRRWIAHDVIDRKLVREARNPEEVANCAKRSIVTIKRIEHPEFSMKVSNPGSSR